jgi:hypothetical protein
MKARDSGVAVGFAITMVAIKAKSSQRYFRL